LAEIAEIEGVTCVWLPAVARLPPDLPDLVNRIRADHATRAHVGGCRLTRWGVYPLQQRRV